MDLEPLRRVSTAMDAVHVFDPVVQLPRARYGGIAVSVLAHAAVLYVLASPALYVDQQMPAPSPYFDCVLLEPPPPPPPPPVRTVERLQPQSERSHGCGSLFARTHHGGWTLAPAVMTRLRAQVARVTPYYGEVTTARATGARRATSSLEVCLTNDGTVTSVDVATPSGLSRWDDDLVRALENMHDTPCAIVREPARACAVLDVTYEL